MPSLAILEGLIGTGCAIACLYYARLGALAGPQNYVHADVPWHSALGEYARRNPFAAVFGALAFGFLVSSWSMYALPRPTAAEPPAIEKWHTITKTVPTADPAQAAKIASLQAAVNADNATIAAQTAELARLKQSLGKSSRRSRRWPTTTGAIGAAGPEGTAADLNKTFNPAGVTGGATAPVNLPPPAPAQSTVTPAGNAQSVQPTPAPSAAPQSSATTPPH